MASSAMDANAEQLVFLDLETGGLETTRPIIQLAAIAINARGRELEQIELKIRFDDADCSTNALNKNNYDPELWLREALPEEEAADRFADFLRRHATPSQEEVF